MPYKLSIKLYTHTNAVSQCIVPYILKRNLANTISLYAYIYFNVFQIKKMNIHFKLNKKIRVGLSKSIISSQTTHQILLAVDNP